MAKYDLLFDPPLMNAAGALGFAPNEHGPVDLASFSVFITNPISLSMRAPAKGGRFALCPSGFLLHTGHPNPGLRAVLRHYAPTWRRSPIPVVVHLLAQNGYETRQMVSQLEGVAGVAGIELGFAHDVSLDHAQEMVNAAVGELPVIVQLPLERVFELSYLFARRDDITAISLGPPRGVLPGSEGKGILRGRLYGPAVFPIALAALYTLQQMDLNIIGAGGVYQPQQVEAMRAAGAVAVQLDTALWRGEWWSREDQSTG